MFPPVCDAVTRVAHLSPSTPVPAPVPTPFVAHPLELPELLTCILDQFFALPASRVWLKDKVEKGQDVAAFESTCKHWQTVVHNWLPYAPDKFRLRAARSMFSLRVAGQPDAAQRLEAARSIVERYRVLVSGYALDYQALAEGSDWRIHSLRNDRNDASTRALALAARVTEKSGKGRDDEKDRPLPFDSPQLAEALCGDEYRIYATRVVPAGGNWSYDDFLAGLVAQNRGLKELRMHNLLDKNLLRGLPLRRLHINYAEDYEDLFEICPTIDCLKLSENISLGEKFWSKLLARDQLSSFMFDFHNDEHGKGLYDYLSQSKNLRTLCVYLASGFEADDLIFDTLWNGLAINSSLQKLTVQVFTEESVSGLLHLLAENNSLKTLTLYMADDVPFLNHKTCKDLANAFRWSPSLQSVHIDNLDLDDGSPQGEKQTLSFIEDIFAPAVNMAPALQLIDLAGSRWRKSVRKNDKDSGSLRSPEQQ